MVSWEKVIELTEEVADFIRDKICEGASLLDIAGQIEKKIFDLGAKPAFPPNLSLNEVAAHYTPMWRDPIVLKSGDLLKVDFGLRIGSICSDFAFSTSIGKEVRNAQLINAAEQALSSAARLAKPGVAVCELGKAIEEVAFNSGCNVIRNLSGHGLSENNLHAEPTIPNYDNKDGTKLLKGQVIAIEPFMTFGRGLVSETSQCEIFSLKEVKPMKQKEVLEFIKKEYGSFPFAKRWLIEKFGPIKTHAALKEALAKGVLMGHRVLKDVDGSKVAQAEKTIILK